MGLALSFDGTNDYVRDQTNYYFNTDQDWSFGAWVMFNSAAPATSGSIMEAMDSDAVTQQRWFYQVNTTGRIQCRVGHATTNAEFSVAAPSTGVWYCLVVTYSASSNVVSLFIGDPATPMAEPSYVSQVTGVGAQRLDMDYQGIGGNPNNATSRPFNGRIAWPWMRDGATADVTMAERFRVGHLHALWSGGVGPTYLLATGQGVAYDLIGQRAWTVSGVTEVDGPPVAMRFARRAGGWRPAATAATVAGTLAGSSATTGTIAATRTVTGAVAGSSATTGTITGTRIVGGVVAGSSTATGTITGTRIVGGVVAGSSTATGTITGTRTVSGTVAGSSDATGTITVGSITVAGTLAGSSATTGTATGTRTVTATAAGSSAGAGTATGTRTVNGTAASVVAVTSTITGTRTVLAAFAGTSATTGTIAGVGGRPGVLAGSSSATGTATGLRTVTGTLAGASVVTGTITAIRTVYGTALGAPAVAGVIVGTVTAATYAVPADRSIVVRPDWRLIDVEPDNRTVTVGPDHRTITA